MELGPFSISLAVKDLQASRQFYEKFGFEAFGGDPSQNWLILKNGPHVIGLFQGMFDKPAHVQPRLGQRRQQTG
jgi:lactoylglutathione lyase